MAEKDWEYPFSIPRMVTEEYERAKAEYVAKHGYTITIPFFEDIFHFRLEKRPTKEEIILWAKGDVAALGPERFEEIEAMAAKRKRRLERMLASPAPTWATNLATVINALDDMEDALTSLAVVGRIIVKFLPPILKKLLSGPISLFLHVSDVINLVNSLLCFRMPVSSSKKMIEDFTSLNPFSRKAAAKRAKKMKRLFPSVGEWLEIFQTTDSLYRRGVSLGPIMGLLWDVAFGTYRKLAGERVEIRRAPPPLLTHEYQALRTMRILAPLWSGGQVFTDEDHFLSIIAGNFSMQVVNTLMQEWNPLDEIDGIENMLICAPKVENPLTRKVLEDMGYDPDTLVGWPHLDKECATLQELMDVYGPINSDTFGDFMARQQHTPMGHVAGNLAHQWAESMLANLEGPEQVRSEFHPKVRQAMKHIHNNWHELTWVAIIDQIGPFTNEEWLTEKDWLKQMYFDRIGSLIGVEPPTSLEQATEWNNQLYELKQRGKPITENEQVEWMSAVMDTFLGVKIVKYEDVVRWLEYWPPYYPHKMAFEVAKISPCNHVSIVQSGVYLYASISIYCCPYCVTEKLQIKLEDWIREAAPIAKLPGSPRIRWFNPDTQSWE